MKLRNLAAATAALSLTAAPVAAQADISRDVAPVQGEAQLGGDDRDGSGIILLLLALAAIAAGIYIAVDDGDDDPISP